MSLFVTLSLGCSLLLFATIATLIYTQHTMLVFHMSKNSVWLTAGTVFCHYALLLAFLYYH
ncbi:hypothetical protein A9G42_04840 [Gilliamella sp. Nev6-6]|nr:hypothetical protein A9G47_02435 [Gilliamella apicola]OCG77629.1 hypothetical protein A9G42_04840 [Gilliamella apicola]